MADMLFTGLFLISVHLVVSQDAGKCGSPLVYQDKRLDERYATRHEFNNGDLVRYKCILGYTPVPDSGRESYCQRGQWTRLDLQCVKKKCGSAGELENGRLNQEGNTFGDKAYAMCNKGYILQGDAVRECLVNGWSGTVPTCVEVKCHQTEIKNAKVMIDNQKFSTQATITCNMGFTLRGPNVITCAANGSWVPAPPTCVQVSKCPFLSIKKGKVSSSNRSINTTTTITCNKGFTLSGPNVITCAANGSWVPAQPSCVRGLVQVTCPPPAVPNSKEQLRNKMYKVGETVTIICQDHFILRGSSEARCGSNGKWQAPECLPTRGRCSHPTYPDNAIPRKAGITNRETYESGTSVEFKCSYGYQLASGSRTIQCNNGHWTPSDIICKKKHCGSAGEIVNGAFLYTGISFGDTARAECNEGYLLVGSDVINCRAGGWDRRAPLCEAVQCPQPPKVPGAVVDLKSTGEIRYHQVASYRCLTGKLIGNSDIYCTKQGNWSATVFHCQEPCPNPEVMAGMIVSGYSSRYLAGNVVSMRCIRGWKAVGSGVITCGEDGFWKPRLPKCVKK